MKKTKNYILTFAVWLLAVSTQFTLSEVDAHSLNEVNIVAILNRKKYNKILNLNPGPCFFPFMENCLTGPYYSTSLTFSSGEIVGTSNSNNSYWIHHQGQASPWLYETSSRHTLSSDTRNSLYGTELALGYDFGGLRNELSYSYSRGSINNISIRGVDTTFLNNNSSPMSINEIEANIDPIDFGRQNIIYSIALDIPTGSKIIPYVSTGVGISFISIGAVDVKTSDACGVGSGDCDASFENNASTNSAIVYQVKTGLAYRRNFRTTIFVEGAYDYLNSIDVGNISLPAFGQYSGKIGVRYRF